MMRTSADCRRGLTLIEMVISLSLLTIIMGGSASLVMVASKALANDASNVGSDALAARSAADQIMDDLKVATAIPAQSATAITMTVPDRDGDNTPETIRYAWSGITGAALTRQYNSRTAATVAKNVYALNFAYLSKTVGKPPPVEGADAVLFVHLAAANIQQATIDSSRALAAYYKPTLPAKAVYWKIKNCQVRMNRPLLATGTITARLFYANASKIPAGAALQTATLSIVDLLGSNSWTTIAFGAPADLDPSKSVCIVFTYATLLGAGPEVFYHDQNADANMALLQSGDGGATWGSPLITGALQSRVYGTITTQEAETLEFQALPVAP